MSRRAWLRMLTACAGSLWRPGGARGQATRAVPAAIDYRPADPATRLRFPRDYGAHPGFRTEWWYVTGWLRAGDVEFGVQVTFFRARTAHDDSNPSRFAPKQLLLAHAALALPNEPRLRHAQRAARTGFGLAEASESDCELRLGDWSLARGADDRYRARIGADRFEIDLEMRPPGPALPQGADGFSRKGPAPLQASHYYSRPQLEMQATIALSGDAGSVRRLAAIGRGWLDHEWSSELLDPRAAGWDWIGINFDDGSALMAFRIRSGSGGVVWSHARWIGETRAGTREVAVRFEALRQWRSLRSGADYPVQMRVTAGTRTIELRPLIDDQELDARASTGIVYWEGAVRAFEDGRQTGRGYLELTGYAGPVRL